MWSKITAWLLALFTALLNNFGLWQQPNIYYKGDPGYAVQEEAVDYNKMHTWYNNLFKGNDATCIVEATTHQQSTGVRGVGYLIADKPFNPDAEMVLSDEDIIIAPGRCKVVTQPSTNSNRIVVQNSEQGAEAFKMEITNPKRWFCCENVNPTASGTFYHKQEDHRIELNQGQTICIASSETEITLYRGTGRSGDLQRCTLREFLRAADTEEGDSSVNLDGSTEQRVTITETKSDALCTADIPDERIFTGPNGWQQDGNRWWWGRSGTATVDWPADQYVIYEGMYYYFGADGYMVTGWSTDGYYHYADANAYGAGRSEFKQGALCYNTIVPDPDSSGYYSYVDTDGTINNDKFNGATISAERQSYVYDEGQGKYKTSSTVTSEMGSGETGDSGNNNGGSGIPPQDNPSTGTLTSSEFSEVTSGGTLESGQSGWYSYNDDWVLLEEGGLADADDSGYSCAGEDVYSVTVNGTMYFFYEDTGVLVKGTSYGQEPVYVSKSDNRTEWYIVKEDLGVIKNAWWRTPSRWLYASSTGVLYNRGLNSVGQANGVYTDPDNSSSGLFYVFDEDCYLNTTDQELIISDEGATWVYTLVGNIEGARTRTLR